MRLTTGKAVENMDMVELAHNCCYAEDKKARYRDYDMDIDAREFAKKLLVNLADDAFIDDSDETFDEVIHDYLQYGTDNLVGLIALFYQNLWAMADLRETLKAYEDAEEQGLLIRLPVAEGTTVFGIIRYFFRGRNENQYEICECKFELSMLREIGKTIFLTREEAEAALAEKGGAE